MLQEAGGREAVRQGAGGAAPRTAGSAAAQARAAAIPIPVSNSVETTTGTPRGRRGGGDLGDGDRAPDAGRLHDEDVGGALGEQAPGGATAA